MGAEEQKRSREKYRQDSTHLRKRQGWAQASTERLRAALADPEDPRHGTLTGYTKGGCRCGRCGEAMREHAVNRKEVAGADFRANLSDPRHGSLNGYNNLACRCETCRSAHRTYYEQKKARRRREHAPTAATPSVALADPTGARGTD